MNLQQGAFSLADAFKSFSKTATGSSTAVYTVPTANEGAVPPILDYDASSPLDIEVFKESLADGAESEILTQPIILEQQDAVKILGNGVKILVSLMEIS